MMEALLPIENLKFFANLNENDLFSLDPSPEIEKAINDVLIFKEISSSLLAAIDQFKKKQLDFRELKSFFRIELEKLR